MTRFTSVARTPAGHDNEGVIQFSLKPFYNAPG